MPALNFSKSVDTEHEVKLDSTLVYANWTSSAAVAGGKAAFEIGTSFVGDGAKIEVVGKSVNGTSLGKVSGKIGANSFSGELNVPEDIDKDDEVYFEVKLSANGLSGKSTNIPAIPKVKVKKLEWGQAEAKRGDIVSLKAEFEGVRNGTEVIFKILEYDADSAHDRITELGSEVVNQKAEVKWEYEYHEDTDDIPTQDELDPYGGSYAFPEYFFTITISCQTFGKAQESGLLRFKDHLELTFINDKGEPMANAKYKLLLADGSEKSGNLDSDGKALIHSLPPGPVMAALEEEEMMQA